MKNGAVVCLVSKRDHLDGSGAATIVLIRVQRVMTLVLVLARRSFTSETSGEYGRGRGNGVCSYAGPAIGPLEDDVVVAA
jgi:hypothetical protein